MQQIPVGETPQSNGSVNSKRRFRFDAYQMIDSIIALKPWINRQILFPQLVATRPRTAVLSRAAHKQGFTNLEDDPKIHKALGMEEMRSLMRELNIFKFIHDAIREAVLQEGVKPNLALCEFTPSHHSGTPNCFTPQDQNKLASNSRGAQVQRALNFWGTEEERTENQEIESVYSEANNVRGSGRKLVFKIERKAREGRNRAQKQQSKLEDYFKAEEGGIERTLKIIKGE